MILVVDDDKTIRLSLKLILERNGYEVTLAEGPKEAIQIVRNTPAVELVLMDMNYSRATDGEEGMTLLRQVKVFMGHYRLGCAGHACWCLRLHH